MDRSIEQPLDIRSSGRGDARLHGVTEAAHQTTDKVARAATVQVDRLRGTAHEAVDGAASLVESASASIRARPMTAVASVLAVGYLLGWLTRR